ncbi:MAG: hypothetical protein JJU29_12025 [Verrucomicrobia bacterium]|nr:hypothetical protein [Verrucomicrobiota bacterium]MCH8511681.1 hypothetical protein [Kiritimatiellia bacterium]
MPKTKLFFTPPTFAALIRGLKWYALVAFLLPFPVAYWRNTLWVDVLAIFFFPIAADKLEHTRNAHVAAWLWAITTIYCLLTFWLLTGLLLNTFASAEFYQRSPPVWVAVPLIGLYGVFSILGLRLLRGLRVLLKNCTLDPDGLSCSHTPGDKEGQ